MANFQVGSPIDYGQPRNLGVDIASGVAGIYQGLQGFQQQQAQQAEQQAMKEFQGAFGQAYASGDRDAMRQLVAKYPGQFEQVQKGLTIMNADNQQRMGEASADLRMAASTGNHEAVAAAASKHQDLLQSLGTSPEDIARSYQQDPQAFAFQADMIGLHSLGPEKYFDVMDKRAQRDIQREGQRVQMRGQDIQVRGQDISASNAALDRQIKMLEVQQRSLDRQAARETNDLKRQELQQKLASNQQAIEQAKAEKNDALKSSYNSTTEALDLVKDLRGSKGLSSAVGWQSAAPTIPGSQSADFETKFEQLQGMLTLENMGIMKGVLSDSDIKMIKAASAGLNLGMSEKEFKNRLGVIEKKLESKLSSTTEKNPDLFKGSQTMSDDDLINKYLR